MASQSSKKLASNNTEALNKTHLQSLVVNLVVILSILILRRPKSYKTYLILSLPSFAIQYSLERNGRPSYVSDTYTGNKKLVKSGEDISGEGLYEYMFDILYITWTIDILMIMFGTNYVWWLYSVIPGYAVFKLAKFVLPFFMKDKSVVTAESSESNPTKSKRQVKLEARREKGQNIKYR